MPKWALWIMSKISAFLLWIIIAWSSLCRNPLYVAFASLSSQYAHVCMYSYLFIHVFLDVLQVFFFLPSHLELLSQASCKVESLWASHLNL